MNIQQIDLDKNLVIPLPEGFTKEGLAIISARYSNYQDKVDQYNTHTFVGTQKEFENVTKDSIFGINAWIIETEKLEDEKIVFTYQTLNKIDNPVSIVEFGIAKAIVPLGNYIREAIKAIQTKQEELILEQKKQEVQEQLLILDDIKGI